MARHHKERREAGNVPGNYRRTVAGERGIVVDADNDSRMRYGALPGLIVYLREAGSDERRAFRRWCAGKGLRERIVETVRNNRGQEIPYALEVSGLPDSLQAVIDATNEPNPLIIRFHAIMDAPTFGRAAGSGELSESARRFGKLNGNQQRERLRGTN